MEFLEELTCKISPRRVDALARETVTAVSAAKYTTFAITSDGVLYAQSSRGRLGYWRREDTLVCQLQYEAP